MVNVSCRVFYDLTQRKVVNRKPVFWQLNNELETFSLFYVKPKDNQFDFETTGLHFIEPVLVTNNFKFCSRYVLIFTCVVVQADNQVVSNGFTNDSTANCVRLFIS